jgi:hypothetical protein
LYSEDEGGENVISSLWREEFFEDCVAGEEKTFAWLGEFETYFDEIHWVGLRG